MNSTIVDKLNHSLEEVRNRALRTIEFKLKTGILNIVQLSHEHHLVENLISWLTQEEVEYQSKWDNILRLLKEIALKSYGKKRILEGGGIRLLRNIEKKAVTVHIRGLANELIQILISPDENIQYGNIGQETQNQSFVKRGGMEQKAVSVHTLLIKEPSSPPILREEETRTSFRTISSPHNIHIRRSPERFHKKPQANDYQGPPCVPNSFISFEHVYLSPIDEEIVSHFCSIVNSPTVDVNEEGRLFDILSIDVGSNIFLQRSQLFRAIMNGLESESDPRLYQNLEYLETLIMEWSKLFRKSADIISPLYSNTPVNNTPNTSLNAVGPENVDSATSVDYSISLPFAAHEIFIKLIGMIKYIDLIPLLLRILYGVLPFLKLHIEFVLNKLSRDPEGISQSYSENLVLYYFYHISDAFGSFEKVDSTDLYLFQIKEELLYFALRTLSCLASVVEVSNSSILTAIEALIDTAYSHSLPGSFLTYLLKTEDVGFISDSYFYFLSHFQPWIRYEAYQRLMHYYMDSNLIAMAFVEDFSLLSFLVEKGLFDQQDNVKNAAYKILSHFFSKTDDSELVKQLMPWMIASDTTDSGQLFDTAYSKIIKSLMGNEKVVFWITILLCRHSRLRQLAVDELRNFKIVDSEDSRSTQELADSFMIPAGMISRLASSDETNNENALEKKDVQIYMQENIPICSNDGASVEETKSAIYRISTVIHWNIVQEKLIESQFIEFCIEKIQDFSADNDTLVYLTKILRVLYEYKRNGVDLAYYGQTILFKLGRLCFHSNTEIRYNICRISAHYFFSNLSSSDQNSGLETVSAPSLIVDSFIHYSPIERVSKNYQLSLDEVRLGFVKELLAGRIDSLIIDYRSIAKMPFDVSQQKENFEDLYSSYIKNSLDRLKSAKSHGEFERTFHEITGILLLDFNESTSSLDKVYEMIHRFIKVAPASADDRCLLSKILYFSSRLLRNLPTSTLIDDEFLDSIHSVLIPILYEQAHKESIDSTIMSLSTEIIGFLASVFRKLDQSQLSRIINSSKFVKTIVEFAFFVFSSEKTLSRSHFLRLNCLSCILTFSSLQSLLTTVNAETISHLIRLLVQIIGSFQETFAHFADGNSFTFKDACVYRWTILCLRNLSRSVISFNTVSDWCLWGDHWLFAEDINWLLSLLNDDDMVIQKLGLGILSNFILIKGSSELLNQKIPRFLDMAILYVLDFDRHEMIRMESILIINNFIFLQSQERRSVSEFGEEMQRYPSDDGVLAPLIKTFEQACFFEQLGEIIESWPQSSIGYRAALIELLLNLSLVLPFSYWNEKLLEFELWPILIEYLSLNMDSSASPGDPESALFERFRQTQFSKLNSSSISLIQCNVFQIIRVLTFEEEALRAYLLSKTNVLMHLKHIIGSNIKVGVSSEINPIIMACRTLGDFLSGGFDQKSSDILEFLQDQNFIFQILKTCLRLIKSCEDTHSRRVGCYLISRLFTLHFGEIVFLDLNIYLESEIEVDHKVECMGISFYHELVEILIENYDPTDSPYMESVRLSLQCLLGRCGYVKMEALKAELPLFLEKRAIQVLESIRGSSKVDEASQIFLFIVVALFRHLLAGYEQVKIACIGIVPILYEILILKGLAEPILLETLCCVRNLISNCQKTKKKLLESFRSGRAESSSILDVVLKMMSNSSCSPECFYACADLVKALALNPESRAVLLKSWLTLKLPDTINRFIKLKKTSCIEILLEYLVNLTFTADGQSCIIRISGILYLFLDLLSSKSISTRLRTLIVLRNLASLKENKAHFLVDGTFLTLIDADKIMIKLGKITSSKSLKILSACTSLLWILVYDCEKAKVCIKRVNMVESLVNLEKRLISDYNCLDMIQKGSNIVPNGINDEDYQLLLETLKHLSNISRLLR